MAGHAPSIFQMYGAMRGEAVDDGSVFWADVVPTGEAVTRGQRLSSPTWQAGAVNGIPFQTITKSGQEPECEPNQGDIGGPEGLRLWATTDMELSLSAVSQNTTLTFPYCDFSKYVCGLADGTP